MSRPPITNFSPIKAISLKNHPSVNEAWVQQVLYENPAMLGLGPDVNSRDKERIQPSGGRLDLLLQDDESETRYEVEVQLGATDETHIIRTIEYWDIERKRYPQYDHVAVIVAEDITARFFNVISLFNSAIPLIALKMTAIENTDGTIGLPFTKVLDLATPATEDEPASEATDRNYWDKRACKETMRYADEVLGLVKVFEPDAEFNYTKFYCGIWVNGKANNFIVIRPKKKYCLVDIRLEKNEVIDEQIENSVFEAVNYTRERRYRLRIDSRTLKEGKALLSDLIKAAYEA